MKLRLPLLAFVAAAALPASTAQAGVDLMVAPALVDAPMLAKVADLVDRLTPEFPSFIDSYTAEWQARIDSSLRGFAETLRDLTAYTAPDLRPITTEPIAASHFFEESSGYGWRNDPILHHPKFHAGTDFRGKMGTPVLAAGDGTVFFAGQKGGYGNIVIVDHGNGLMTRYGHMRRIVVKKGAVVTAGTEVGELGRTGRATGPHLHFEVRLDGRPVDPQTAMTVANLQRENPVVGDLAAQALAPELQANAASSIDPPKSGVHAKKKSKTSDDETVAPGETRPERTGHVHKAKPLS